MLKIDNGGLKINGTLKATCSKNYDIDMGGGGSKIKGHNGYFDKNGNPICGLMANKRDVWKVSTEGLKEDFYAQFPKKLIEPMVLAGCPKGGGNIRSFYGKWHYWNCFY